MIRIVLAVAVAALGVTAVVAQGDPIAARKALMKENGAQSGIAREMMEGKRPFDLAAAKKVLTTFGASATKAKALFPANSKTGSASRHLGKEADLRRLPSSAPTPGRGAR
jgi:cytochrome c556